MRCDNSLATQALQDIRPHLTAMTYNKAHILWHNPQCTTGATVNSPLAPYVQVRTWAPTGTTHGDAHDGSPNVVRCAVDAAKPFDCAGVMSPSSYFTERLCFCSPGPPTPPSPPPASPPPLANTLETLATDLESSTTSTTGAVATVTSVQAAVRDEFGRLPKDERDGTGRGMSDRKRNLAQNALNLLSNALGVHKAKGGGGRAGGRSPDDLAMGSALISFTAELAESLTPHVPLSSAPVLFSTESISLMIVSSVSGAVSSMERSAQFDLELSDSGTTQGRHRPRGRISLPRRDNATSNDGSLSLALYEFDVHGNATDSATADYFVGVVSLKQLSAQAASDTAARRRLSEAISSADGVSIGADGATTTTTEPLVISFDATSLPTQGGGNCSSTSLSMISSFLTSAGDGQCLGGVCCENKCKCAPGYYGPYCEVRVDCGQWNASQSGWATDSCSLTSEVAASYTVNERVPGTDFTWANCSCAGVSEGDFTLTMFGLSQRWLPTSNVAMDEETLVEFGSRLVTTGEGWVAMLVLVLLLGGSMARAHLLDARFAQMRRPPSWWIPPKGADWSWVWRTRFHLRKKHPLFQLWNVVGGYSDVTRLHLTIVLFSSLLLTWATELAFFERPSCFFQAEVVGMGMTQAIIFIWHIERWFFRQAYSQQQFGVFGRERVGEMLRQKTARPKNFREVQKSIDLGVSALGLDLPRRAGEIERRRRSAASQVHGWLSRCMQSLRLARGQEAAQEQRAQGARVDDVACGVASVASCAVSTTEGPAPAPAFKAAPASALAQAPASAPAAAIAAAATPSPTLAVGLGPAAAALGPVSMPTAGSPEQPGAIKEVVVELCAAPRAADESEEVEQYSASRDTALLGAAEEQPPSDASPPSSVAASGEQAASTALAAVEVQAAAAEVDATAVHATLPVSLRVINLVNSLRRNVFSASEHNPPPCEKRQVARPRKRLGPIAVWVPYDALHRVNGHWAVVVCKAPALDRITSSSSAEPDTPARASDGRHPEPSAPARGSVRRSSIDALLGSVARLLPAHSSSGKVGEDASPARRASKSSVKGSTVVPVHSIGVHALPKWVMRRWDPCYGEMLVVHLQQRDLPKELQGLPKEGVLRALEADNLVGDGPLMQRRDLGLLQKIRSAPWAWLFAWTFNLLALLAGVFVFLYSVLVVFQHEDADASFIGGFIASYCFDVFRTIFLQEMLAAMVVAALPYSSKWTYWPCRIVIGSGLGYLPSLFGWERLGFDYVTSETESP